MEFKTGDRVHVMRLDGQKVDFYATLGIYDEFYFRLKIVVGIHSILLRFIDQTQKNMG